MAFKLKNKGIPEKFQNGYNRQSSLGFENPETPNKFIFGKLRDEISEDVGVWGYQNAWPRVKQAIFGNENNPDWVHVSYVDPGSNRNRCLKAYREDGKTKYMVI